MTLVVGDNAEGEVCRIFTTAESADEPKYIEFLLPAASQTCLQPGKPIWANYVKGVIDSFPENGEEFWRKGCLPALQIPRRTKHKRGDICYRIWCDDFHSAVVMT